MNPDQTDPKGESYLDLLQYWIPKNIFRRNGQSKSVSLVGKG